MHGDPIAPRARELEALRAKIASVHGERRAREAYRRGLLLAVVALWKAAEERRELARDAMRLALEQFEAADEDAREVGRMLDGFADDAEEGPGLYRGLDPPVERAERRTLRVVHGWSETPRVVEFPWEDE